MKYLLLLILLLILLILTKYNKFFDINENYKNSKKKNKIVIITRFSILDCDSEGWVLTRKGKSCSDIKKKLFDEDRIKEKLLAFEKITYDSLIKQKYKNFIWLICISNEYPKKYLSKLKKILTSNKGIVNKIKLIPVKNMKDFDKRTNEELKNISKKYNYISVRLDDDDGLAPFYLSQLSKYHNIDNHVISFPYGRKVTFKNKKVIESKKITDYKKNAQGLSVVNNNIYKLGDHTKVDKKNNIIYNISKDAYRLFCSNHTDTRRKI